MHLRIFILLICFYFARVAKAQFMDLDKAHYLDSIQQLLHPGSVASDSIKAMANFSLSDYWSAKDTGRAYDYLEAAKQISSNSPFFKGLYKFYQAGIIFDHDIEQSQALYMEVDSLLSSLKTPESYYFQAKAWNNYCLLEQYKDNKENYVKLMVEHAIPLAKASGRNDQLSLMYVNLGIAFSNIENYDKADAYMSLGIQAIQKGPYYVNSVASYAYLNSVKNKLLLDELEAAKKQLDTAYQIIRPYPDAIDFLDYYEYLGMYYRQSGNYSTAITSLNKGLHLAHELHATYNIYSLNFQKYKAFSDQEQYHSAKVILDSIMNSQVMSLSYNRLMVFYEMAKTNARISDYKQAYDWLEKYGNLRDSLHEVDLQGKINGLEIKFRTSEKEKQILKLQAEKNLKELEAERVGYTTKLLFTICLFLAFLVLLAVLYYRAKNRQKEKDHLNALHNLRQEQQLKVTEALLEGEQRERGRVARDLHDGLGGLLAGVKLRLSGWVSEQPSRSQEPELLKTMSQLDYSVSELRRIARNMIPETLFRFGLEQALRDMADYYNNAQVQVYFQAFGLRDTIPVQVQLNIYRIIQELVSNAVKHAEASQINIQCSQNQRDFLITVEDNGKGFEVDKLTKQAGIGLDNLRSRIALLRGKMDIQSSATEGTTVNIEIEIYDPASN